MQYFGKILGFMIGLLLYQSLGAVIGILIGHFIDLGRVQEFKKKQRDFVKQSRKIFFQSTFAVMGYLAKVDGRVSEKEIQVARSVMTRLGLTGKQKLRAIHYFNYGKSPDFNFDEQLTEFIRYCGAQTNLVELFVEIQLINAQADHFENQYKQYALKRICERLKFPMDEIESLLRQQRAEREYQEKPKRSSVDELTHAYLILGVSKEDDDKTIKKAYKKLVSQNHPDKLVAKGLPEEMIKLATEKMQNIQKAYEVICKVRSIS